jgi:Transcriptional regulator, AbiEi antitoxin
LVALASRQHGVVSLRQLLQLGFSRDAIRARVRTGRLLPLHRGVYAVGHLALTGRSKDLAAVLACGPEALLSHRSAGKLWGILHTSTARIEVTAPRSRGPREGVVVHRSRVIHADDRAIRDATPVTSLARTVVDLAEVLSEPWLGDAVNEAEVQRLFDLSAVEAALGRVPGRKGRHRLSRVLAAYQPEPVLLRNEAERLLFELCERHDLPRPLANVSVAGHDLDLFWPDGNLGVEFDGFAVHGTRRAFHRDRQKDRQLAGLDIHVARVTSRDLQGDGSVLAGELGRALNVRRMRVA